MKFSKSGGLEKLEKRKAFFEITGTFWPLKTYIKTNDA